MDDDSVTYFNGGVNVTSELCPSSCRASAQLLTSVALLSAEVEVIYDESPVEPYSSSTITLSKDYAQGGEQIAPFDV